MRGGDENDVTFDHTLYTGANLDSFGGVDVILNQFECSLNVKTFRTANERTLNKPFKNASCQGRIQNFFQKGDTNFRHFFKRSRFQQS